MKTKDIGVDLKEIEEEDKKNFKERLNFIKFWADYIKTHSDEDWSSQQNMLIDNQISEVTL